MFEIKAASRTVPLVVLLLSSMLAGCGGSEPAAPTETAAPQVSANQEEGPSAPDTAAASDENLTQTDEQAAATPAPAAPVETTESLRTAQATPTAAAACAATTLDVASVSASLAQDGNPAVNAIDGDLSTRWSGLGKGAYITADLGGRKQVCAVTLGWYLGNQRTNQFALSTSEDGVNFSPLYTGSSALNLALQTYNVTPTTARYVRLTVNGNTMNDWASVTELQVQGGSAGFVHPGILVTKAQLNVIKDRLFTSTGVPTNAQPWTKAFNNAKTGKADRGANSGVAFGSLSWTPHPVAYVGCGAYNNPNEGCYDETTDAMAAYTHALLWSLTGNAAHAQKAIEIMNAWSGKLIDHKFDTRTYTNGLLQSAWAGEIFPKAAEIIRHTYTPAAGQTPFNVARFSNMLRTAYLPHVINGWTGGGANWLLSMAEATMNIGIFLDDKATFDRGVAAWRAQVPAMIYMAGDVNRWPQLAGMPISPPGTMYDKSTTTAASFRTYWRGATSFVSGLQGETCRDANHSAMGFGAMFNAAETARIQGIDLWGEQKTRITTAMEKNTAWIAAAISGTNPPPGWVCPNAMNTTNGVWKLTWEVAYNHYAYRLGMNLPNTGAFLANTVRPATYDASLFTQYETLTHYQQP